MGAELKMESAGSSAEALVVLKATRHRAASRLQRELYAEMEVCRLLELDIEDPKP